MNVLSLFDGISAGQLALKNAGVEVDNYYASEIDKYAIKVAVKNFPNTIEIGDINNWRKWDIDFSKIDLVIGGSPCQGFSFAGKQLNFDDPRSKLFFEFSNILNHIRLLNSEVKFLLENVRMKKEYQDVITGYLGVSPIKINSSLLSAQNRVRLYWTNIPNVSIPEDKGILLKDILQHDVRLNMVNTHSVENVNLGDNVISFSNKRVSDCANSNIDVINDVCIIDSYNNKVYNDKSPTITTRVSASNLIHLIKKEDMVLIDDKYYLSEKAIEYMSRLRNGKPRWEYHKNDLDGKAACLTANMYKGVPYGVLRIPEATKKGYVDINPNEGVDLTFINSKTRRGRRMEDKSNCLTATNYDYCWYDGFVCRKLTPIECERLQTFPDNYTDGVSSSQRYKALGNSWTVDVISHIFKNLK
jgi:DNA (cytosine-5)-methyltransferase 3A